MARALSWGLTLHDFDLLTVGMIADFISESYEDHQRQQEGSGAAYQQTGVRAATQADFDRF
jgi:hypothetical protein